MSSESSWVALDIDSSLLLEVDHAVVDEFVVEVLTTQVSVTVGGLDLEDTFLDGEEGDIEGTTTKIENEDVSLLSLLAIKTVGDGGGGWLVDDSEHVDTSDGSSILGGLSLSIVEVSWHSDDSGLDGLAEECLSDLLHFGEDHGGNLLSLELLGLSLVLDNDHWLVVPSSLDLEWPELDVTLDGLVRVLSANESLGIKDSVEWVSGGLVLGSVSDQSLVLSEGDVRWRGVQSLIVGDDLDLIVEPHSDAGVGGSKIDSDCGVCSHCRFVFECFQKVVIWLNK